MHQHPAFSWSCLRVICQVWCKNATKHTLFVWFLSLILRVLSGKVAKHPEFYLWLDICLYWCGAFVKVSDIGQFSKDCFARHIG